VIQLEKCTISYVHIGTFGKFMNVHNLSSFKRTSFTGTFTSFITFTTFISFTMWCESTCERFERWKIVKVHELSKSANMNVTNSIFDIRNNPSFWKKTIANRGYSCKPEKIPKFARIPLTSLKFASRNRAISGEFVI
jgi:hypothetical protein